jgi:hypothetical protein
MEQLGCHSETFVYMRMAAVSEGYAAGRRSLPFTRRIQPVYFRFHSFISFGGD